MKKTFIAAAIAALISAPVAADVTVSGTVEQEVIFADGDSVTRNTDVVSGDSEIVFSGSEDLGNGNSAFFKMSMGVNSEGAGSATASKDMYVGLAGEFGSVQVGQFFGLIGTASDKTVDVYETSLGLDVNNSGRVANAAAYTTPSFGGIQGTIAMVSNGAAGEEYADALQYMVSYNTDDLYVAGVLSNDEATDDKVYFLGARASMGDFGLGGGFERQDPTVGAESDLWIVGGDYTFGNNVATIGYQDEDGSGNTWAAELKHSFSKRTSVYGAYQVFEADAVDSDTNTFGAGIRHNF